jgi:hypothetical protein
MNDLPRWTFGKRQRLALVAILALGLCGVLLPGEIKASEPSGKLFLPAIQSGGQEFPLSEAPETDEPANEGTATNPAAGMAEGDTIWYANFDNNYFPGGVAISGLASAAVTSKQAHSGRYSAALSIKNADGFQRPEPGVRLTYNAKGEVSPSDPKNLPDVAYYSAHYYFPQNVTSKWWNVMQWKQAVIESNGSQTRVPVYSIHPLFVNGGMSFFLRSRVNSEGAYQDPAVYVAGSPLVIPLNQWVRLECMYRWSKLADGQITCWMNGELLWDMTNIITEFDTPYVQYPRQWTVNNYAGETLPKSHVLYVDDLAVRTQPLGTP